MTHHPDDRARRPLEGPHAPWPLRIPFDGGTLVAARISGGGRQVHVDYAIEVGGARIGHLSASASDPLDQGEPATWTDPMRIESHGIAHAVAFDRAGERRDGAAVPAIHLHFEDVSVDRPHRGSRISLAAMAGLAAAIAAKGAVTATLCAFTGDDGMELRLARHYSGIGFVRADVTAAAIDAFVTGDRDAWSGPPGPEDGVWMTLDLGETRPRG